MHKGTVRLSVLLVLWAALSCLFLALSAVIHAGYAVGEGGLKYNGQVYTAVIKKNVISVFTQSGEKICEYETGNGSDKIFSSCISDIDADDADEILLIIGQDKEKYGNRLEILKPEAAAGESALGSRLRHSADLRRIYRFDMRNINPWKIQTCDIDGDGRKEISAGVYKTAVFHPVMAKRPFIYNWTDGHMSPKWLGSRLARPFDDYIFCDVNSDGRDELVSAELLADGNKAVNVYAWKGFGFESIGGSDGYEDILKIRNAGGHAIEINAVINRHSERIALCFENGALLNKN